MSFYLKLFLIMSLVGQSIAVACVDIIAGHHDARRKVFNTSSYEGTLVEKESEINMHSGSIRDILIDKQKVNVKRHASTDEKEKILKAVMAERFIAKKIQRTLGGAMTKDVNPYEKNLDKNSTLYGHFKVLELTWQLGDEYGNELLAKLNSQDCKETDQSNYTDLFRLLGIDGSLCIEWLQELVAEHIIGVRPENIVLPPKKDTKEQKDSIKENKSGPYFLRSLAEVSSHPLAIFGIVLFAEIKQEPHDAPIKMDFLDSALKGIASHLGISSEEGPLTAGKAYDLAMEIFGEIAANDNHSLSDSVVAMLSSHETLYAMILRLIKLFGKEQEEKTRKIVEKRFPGIAATKENKDQCAAAIYILETDDFAKETKTIAIAALGYIASQSAHPHYEDAMEKLRFIASDDGHPWQGPAAEQLFKSGEDYDQKIAMDAFIAIAQNVEHKSHDDAMEKLNIIAKNDEHPLQQRAQTWLDQNSSPKTESGADSSSKGTDDIEGTAPYLKGSPIADRRAAA